MLQILFENFLSFDFIIFILALINAFILTQTIRASKKLYDALNPYCWIPGGEASLKEIQGKFDRRNRVDSESDIIRLRRRMNAFYIIYENLTAIFPLLGLLGTVVSLLPLVNDMGDVATGSFFSALTSTMWGIIFAIVFKMANGYVASGIEDNEKNIDIYLQRNTDKLMRLKAIAESGEPVSEVVAKPEPAVVAEPAENIPDPVVKQRPEDLVPEFFHNEPSVEEVKPQEEPVAEAVGETAGTVSEAVAVTEENAYEKA